MTRSLRTGTPLPGRIAPEKTSVGHLEAIRLARADFGSLETGGGLVFPASNQVPWRHDDPAFKQFVSVAVGGGDLGGEYNHFAGLKVRPR